MKTSLTITKLYFLALFFLPNIILSQNQTINAKGAQIQISSTVHTILRQAETVYVPSGYTMDVIYNDAPDMAPIFLGLIMQRQKVYMDQTRNINHIDNYMNLVSQIDAFLSQLAKAHNYINPVDGSKMPPIQLQNSFMETIEGKYNDVYINKFGINPTTANVAYLLDRAPNPNNVGNTDEHAKIDVAEAPTEINLFGEVSGAAENNFNYPTDDRDSQNTSEEVKKQPLKPDVIVGTWKYTKSKYGCNSNSSAEESSESYTFQKGYGKTLFFGETADRSYTLNIIKQINPNEVVYIGTMKWKVKVKPEYNCSNGQTIKVYITRGKNNNIYMCPGTCASNLVPNSLIKIN